MQEEEEEEEEEEGISTCFSKTTAKNLFMSIVHIMNSRGTWAACLCKCFVVYSLFKFP